MRCTRRAVGEKGETLVETLVTIAVLGIGIIALVGGLATAITASASHRQHATGDTIARSIAEVLKDDDWDAGGNYPPSTWSSGSGLVSTTGFDVVLDVTCWGDVEDNDVNDADWIACGVGDDTGLQRLELTVTSQSRDEVETLTFVKRKPADAVP